MADIKLTLSNNTNLRSPNIEEEARWMQEEGPIYYALQGKPKEALPGGWVYFVREGLLAARAKADDFVENSDLPSDEGQTYTGEPSPIKRWSVVCSSMETATHPIPHPGFQGFRYVTPEEQSDFEQAFVA